MTYEQAMDYINGLAKFGIVLGLDNMCALLDALAHPEREQKIIHIAGTNGKGSTGAFIAAMLCARGEKVGRYVSPTVFCYEERFQINGSFIDREKLPEYIGAVKAAAEKSGITPTVFEVETAAALLYFAKEGCDHTLLEVGMGGRLDATNAVQSTLRSVITPIALDHTAVLGDTLDKIAYEKAGIIKQNGVVISAVQQTAAAKVLKAVSSEKNARLTFCEAPVVHADGSFDYKKHKGLKISLAGGYQYQNAALAAEVFDSLYDDDAAVREGLANTVWEGRFQVIAGSPTFIFDGAHNPQGVQALVKSLEKYKNIVYICGIFADKDYKQMVKTAAPLAEKVFTVTPPSPRGLDADILKREFLKYTPDVTAMPLEQAIAAAREMKDSVVAVFGSLSFLGRAIECVRSKNNG
ncbi:MAG: bifunctional folylpolyglutamate synthase/dihydrofolate synthase [Firmicutes bacterium]|nr:bifunctional folylpolyglutamate synthase/dihydrofolate synthase [Bacillota bacterium]